MTTSRSTSAEPSGFDTGSKPNVTYLGDDAQIRDAAGLEPEEQHVGRPDGRCARPATRIGGDWRHGLGRRARLDRRPLLGVRRAHTGGVAGLVHGRRVHDPQRRGRDRRHGRAEASAVGHRRHRGPARRRLHAGRHERRARPGRQLRPRRIDRPGDRRRTPGAAHGRHRRRQRQRQARPRHDELVGAAGSCRRQLHTLPGDPCVVQRDPRPRRGGAGARRRPRRARHA